VVVVADSADSSVEEEEEEEEHIYHPMHRRCVQCGRLIAFGVWDLLHPRAPPPPPPPPRPTPPSIIILLNNCIIYLSIRYTTIQYNPYNTMQDNTTQYKTIVIINMNTI
jgi:hypothetical protein